MDFWLWFSVAATVFVGVCASGWWAYRGSQFARAWRWLRVLSLGGATTLEQDLENYDACRFCLRSMDAGDKVRTLSCDHVFHRGGISKCENGIDNWLRTTLTCPSCFQTPHPVLPWKAPPPTPPEVSLPSETPPSSSGSYGALLPPPGSPPPESYGALFPPLLSPPPESYGALFPPLGSPSESSSGQDDRDESLLSRAEMS